MLVDETTVAAGPRIGTRALLLASPGLGRSLHLDVSAGPNVESCFRCDDGAAVLGMAGQIRLVLGF